MKLSAISSVQPRTQTLTVDCSIERVIEANNKNLWQRANNFCATALRFLYNPLIRILLRAFAEGVRFVCRLTGIRGGHATRSQIKQAFAEGARLVCRLTGLCSGGVRLVCRLTGLYRGRATCLLIKQAFAEGVRLVSRLNRPLPRTCDMFAD